MRKEQGRKRRFRLRAGSFIPPLVVVLLLACQAEWRPLNLKASDISFSIAERLGIGRGVTTGRVVVVGIDERSLADAEPMVFWYPRLGRFIETMRDAGASVVGLDLIPVHSMREMVPGSDEALLRSIKTSEESLGIVQAVSGDKVPFYSGMAPFLGNVSMRSSELCYDDDDFVRRQKLSYSGVDSFAHAVYSCLSGRRRACDEMMLNFSLRKGIPYYSFADVAGGKVPDKAFKGKAVLLGLATQLEDVHLTPLFYRERWLPGVYVHAVAVETLLTETEPEEAPYAVNAVLLVMLGGAGWALSSKAGPLAAVVSAFGISALFFAAVVALSAGGTVAALFPQVLAAPLVVLAAYPYRYFVEEKGRRKLYSTFGRYLDKSIIDRLVDADAGTALGGERREVAVLFSDIRGFTARSDVMAAKDLVGFLNVYFSRMTCIVKRHGGIVDKFIGDGLMAFFGAPVDNGNAARDAVLAAREMLEELGRMNDTGEFRPFIGEESVSIGIGVHYGQAAVGNIGSEQKMDFTVIGRNVNIASRLEGLTKEAGLPLLISRAVYEKVSGEVDLTDLGDYKVKGVEEPVHVYTLTEVAKGALT